VVKSEGVNGNVVKPIASTVDAMHVTVLLGGSCDGCPTDPVIVVPAKSITDDDRRTVGKVKGLLYCSESGSITKHILEEALPIVLNNYRVQMHLKDGEQLVIILDGHSSRYNMDLINTLVKENVRVIIGPAHASHLWQMVDQGQGNALKKGPSLVPSKRVRGINAGVEDVGIVRWKDVLEQRIDNVWSASAPNKITNSWRRSGLHPFDPRCIDARNQTSANLELNTFLKELTNAYGEGHLCRAKIVCENTLAQQNVSAVPTEDELRRLVKKCQLGGMELTNNGLLRKIMDETANADLPKWLRKPEEAEEEEFFESSDDEDDDVSDLESSGTPERVIQQLPISSWGRVSKPKDVFKFSNWD
jgi:hypothetical protein